MLLFFKRFVLVIAALAVGFQSARALSPGGPIGNAGDAWQTAVIGYGLAGDLLAPKNIGEEYRLNVPVYYYSFDANFLGFFGSNGVVAVSGAFDTLNSVFTNNPTGMTNGLDGYSPGLTEFPFDTKHFNYQAQALTLLDLKSYTMGFLMEQMPLASPERYVWTLRSRTAPPGCPLTTTYVVVQRNFDGVNSPLNQLQYSPYVNNTLYTYEILEACTGPNPLAITFPFPTDPLADTFTSVASFATEFGSFYSGLTRDDVAGLRYLFSTNNVNFEAAPAGSLLQTINATNVVPNFDLGAFLASSQTNPPATVATLFPAVGAVNISNYFTIKCTPNVVSYLTNYPGEAVGTVQHFIVFTNGFSCVPVTNYVYSLANMVGVTNATINKNGVTYLQTISLGNRIGAPYTGIPVTNVTYTAMATPTVPAGDFVIVPAGLCGFNLNTNAFILNGPVTATTNLLTTATNANGFISSQSIVTYFTNHYYLYQPVTCAAAPPALRQGIEKIKFVRADFDSLIGQFFQPITNQYTMNVVSNSQFIVERYQRVVTAPDYRISATDLGVFSGSRSVTFGQGNILPGLAGPGIVTTPANITFTKIGNEFANGPLSLVVNTNGFLSELDQTRILLWGSYDSSTNDPVVYPSGTSIQNVVNQMLVQVSPPVLPPGAVGTPYTATFTATGGAFSPPFTWSLASGSAGLPPGLVLSSAGIISGTPTQSGTYDFRIQLTDSLSRTVQWTYTITIP